MTDHDDVKVTAHHEAGHAWAAWVRGVPIDHVTVLPTATHLGHCQPTRAVDDFGDASIVTASGPIAQAIRSARHDPFGDCDFIDHLAGAVLFGGRSDYEQTFGLLDVPEFVDLTRADLEANWDAIEQLAGLLLQHGTLSGSAVSTAMERRHRQQRGLTDAGAENQ